MNSYVEKIRGASYDNATNDYEKAVRKSTIMGAILESGFDSIVIEYAKGVSGLAAEISELQSNWETAKGDWFFNPWQTIEPRAWQRAALPALVASAIQLGRKEGQKARGSLARAIMGAGKAILLAELASIYAGRFVTVASGRMVAERIIITTSTQALVEQLYIDISNACGKMNVGRFYAAKKEWQKRIIVCCIDSFPKLVETLQMQNIPCGLLIADEAHKTETESYLEAFSKLDPLYLIGLTATPYRAKKGESLSLFAAEAFRYGAAEALAEGVIVPWQIELWEGEEAELDIACVEIVKQAITKGPTIATASTTTDADFFASVLIENGVRAAAIHSRTAAARRAELLKELVSGEIQCLVSVNILTEGVNIPEICALVLRRPMASPVAFAQLVGRALRSCSKLIWGSIKKEKAFIYDPLCLFETMRITQDACLGGGYSEEAEPELEAAEVLEVEQLPETARLRVRAAITVSGAASYLVRLAVAFHALGRIPAPRIWGRNARPSDKQIGYIQKLGKELGAARKAGRVVMDKESLLCFRQVYRHSPNFSVGQVSDLIGIMKSIIENGWPKEIAKMMNGE
jgi:superfamily II DNA or RNA helicase